MKKIAIKMVKEEKNTKAEFKSGTLTVQTQSFANNYLNQAVCDALEEGL